MRSESVSLVRCPVFWPNSNTARPGALHARASTARGSRPCLGRTLGTQPGTRTARSQAQWQVGLLRALSPPKP